MESTSFSSPIPSVREASAQGTLPLGGARLDANGIGLIALPQRALWWHDARVLFIADPHLGKAATFRARGLPVPVGTTDENLDRLCAVLAATQAAHLVVLGDFLHAAQAQTPGLLARLARWRVAHAPVAMTLVRGNHDLHAGDPPPALGIRVVDEPWTPVPGVPIVCCHHPQRVADHTVLAGHVHPAVVLQGRGRDALRLPAFCQEPGLVLLPAFGEFTGAHTLGAAAGRKRWAVGAGRVWRLTGA